MVSAESRLDAEERFGVEGNADVEIAGQQRGAMGHGGHAPDENRRDLTIEKAFEQRHLTHDHAP
jgi:hypothetical protein